MAAVLDLAQDLKKSLLGINDEGWRLIPRSPNLPRMVTGIADAGLCPLSCLVATHGPDVMPKVEL